MFERFLERLSQSMYKDNFIIKGGYLIGCMIGIENRVTKDIDATIKDMQIEEKRVETIFKEILSIDCGDSVEFEIRNVKLIWEKFDYPGYRVSFDAKLQKTIIHLKMDVTIGDIIMPEALQYNHQCMFDNRYITFKTYAIETVLAEKIESIISWGVVGSRLRDYYDIYILSKLCYTGIDTNLLKTSLELTATKRKTLDQVHNYNEIISMIQVDQYLKEGWIKFQNSFDYAKDIELYSAIESIFMLLE